MSIGVFDGGRVGGMMERVGTMRPGAFRLPNTATQGETTMILDNLNTTRVEYACHGVKFAKAFKWLRETDLKALTPDTRVDIDGDRVFVQVQSYDTVKPETANFETHRSYVDIQVVVAGREIIQWAPMSKLGKVKIPYDTAKDLEFFEEPEYCTDLRMEEGDFAVFFPSDAHKPRCQFGGATKVLKLVVKVAVQ